VEGRAGAVSQYGDRQSDEFRKRWNENLIKADLLDVATLKAGANAYRAAIAELKRAARPRKRRAK
jgi:hypothetical protein